MRNASVHDLQVRHAGSFSLTHPVCPALLSWKGRITIISEENKYTIFTSNTAYQHDNVQHQSQKQYSFLIIKQKKS